jgi:hypothetical protein
LSGQIGLGSLGGEGALTQQEDEVIEFDELIFFGCPRWIIASKEGAEIEAIHAECRRGAEA